MYVLYLYLYLHVARSRSGRNSRWTRPRTILRSFGMPLAACVAPKIQILMNWTQCIPFYGESINGSASLSRARTGWRSLSRSWKRRAASACIAARSRLTRSLTFPRCRLSRKPSPTTRRARASPTRSRNTGFGWSRTCSQAYIYTSIHLYMLQFFIFSYLSVQLNLALVHCSNYLSI